MVSSILVNIMSRTSRREGEIGERDMIKGMLVISIEAKKVLPRDLECLPSEHLRSRVYRRELCWRSEHWKDAVLREADRIGKTLVCPGSQSHQYKNV